MGDHSFLTDGTTFTTIDAPGATRTDAYGINDGGQIVGIFGDGMSSHSFLTSDGTTFTTIDAPGAVATDAHGINNRGQIVGVFLDATGNHGFLATPDD
jgi:probable HAF family extracellular repeat protein